MAERREIEGPPNTLISLQTPLDSRHGRIQCNPVYSFTDSRKRKRSEISTAVDGAGLSIYTVRNARLVTSYPVSPQTYFQAPPCSICKKPAGSQSLTRHTYAAVTEAPLSGNADLERPQIVHYTESSERQDSTRPLHHVQKLDNRKIHAIEILPQVGSQEHSPSHDVLALYEDGGLLCLDGNLENVRWKEETSELVGTYLSGSKPAHLRFSILVDIEDAARGLLKGREDILANLGWTPNGVSDIATRFRILVIISGEQDVEIAPSIDTMHIFSVQRGLANGLSNNGPPVRHLSSWTIPGPSATHQPITPHEFTLDPSSGLLYHLSSGSLVTFDLTGIVPHKVSTLGGPDSGFGDFQRVSSKRLLTTTSSAFTLFDISFDTIQDVQPLNHHSESVNGSKKRKRLSETTRGTFRFITHFAKLGLVIGLHGTEVFALQLASAPGLKRGAGQRQTLLIDALGKGTRTRPQLNTSSQEIAQEGSHRSAQHRIISEIWEQTRPALDSHASNGDSAAFEAHFVSVVRQIVSALDQLDDATVLSRKPKKGRKAGKVNGITSSHVELDDHDGSLDQDRDSLDEEDFLELLPTSYTRHLREQAIYILSKMFAWTKSPDNRDAEHSPITVEFSSPNVYRWLVVNSYLTPEMVSKALLRKASGTATFKRVTSSDLVSAIAQKDPSTRMLFTLLTEATYVDLSALIRAIKIYVQSHDNSPPGQIGQRTLADSPALVNGDATDVTMHDHGDIDSLLARASADISRAESILDDSFELRTIGLKYALIKLHAFSRPRVTKMLRAELSAAEIRFLIHILRIELQDGGWVSRYVDVGPTALLEADEQPSEDEENLSTRSPSDSAVLIVSSLLSCCVDAIGIGGWLASSSSSGTLPTASSDDLEPHELLGLLKDETIAVLEGLHEMSFIRSSVAEFLRYSSKVQEAEPLPNIKERNKKARLDGSMTKPVTVQSALDLSYDVPSQIAERMKVALPVGLKVEDQKIASTKVASGGEIKSKSKREIGMEISRKVGRYTFEKIRV